MLGCVKDGKAHRHDIGKAVRRLEVLTDMKAQFELPVPRGRSRQYRRVGTAVGIGFGR
jgi:hypothetical protein